MNIRSFALPGKILGALAVVVLAGRKKRVA